ncbi:hypothetical protein [Mesorhizobium mediterraneum]|uniref:hypothetical protein n=1 Tax=Mesorhizobium mediterraneum TaxID=43617 RepID=UPI00177DBA7D|nr:hypothetical protein [Mesorhizobium mediterraneum]
MSSAWRWSAGTLAYSVRYSEQGQAAFKRRFHGIEDPTYVAFRQGSSSRCWDCSAWFKAI